MLDTDDQDCQRIKSRNDFKMIYELFISGKISLPLLVTIMKEKTELSNT